jgi:opacity protein-like surface antigen
MKLTHLTLTAAAAVLASSVALAAPPQFEGADTNADGGVDMAEFEATKIDRQFGELDKDGDGKLNKDEYAAALEEDCA